MMRELSIKNLSLKIGQKSIFTDINLICSSNNVVSYQDLPTNSCHNLNIDNAQLAQYTPHSISELTRNISKDRNGFIVVIKGKNGSGKTCLLQCISGMIPRHIKGELSGTILFTRDGTEVMIYPYKDPLKVHPNFFSFLMQEPNKQICFPYIEEELLFGAENLQRNFSDVKLEYEMLLDCFPFLKSKGKETSSLSFGQKKMLLFSAMVLKDPDIFLLDEFGVGISEDFKKIIKNILLRLKSKGKIIFITEHESFFDEDTDRILYL